MCGVDERIFQSEKEVTAGQTAEGSMRGGAETERNHARRSRDRETGMREGAGTERPACEEEQRQREAIRGGSRDRETGRKIFKNIQ